MDKIVILFIFLVCANIAFAWKAGTHEQFVENVYYSMPDELQLKLNLSRMKEGSIAPDKYFKDFRNHNFPMSLIMAKKWLQNRSDLSYNFGVASHYVSDSFVAPHNIAGEDYNDHSRFEGQVLWYKTSIACKNYGFDINRDLAIATKNSKDWWEWKKSKDKNIAEKEVDQSMMFVYSIAVDYFNYSCRNSTIIAYDDYVNKADVIKAAVIFLFGLPLLYFFKD